MSEKRVRLITLAFEKLSQLGFEHQNFDSECITVEDIMKGYDVKFHPKYKSGELTKKQCCEEFLSSMEGSPENRNRDLKVRDIIILFKDHVKKNQ